MAWQKILALGFLASAVIVGCTVTTDDIGDDEDGGSSGGSTSSTGGKSSTGGSTSSSGGASSTGGASASGGSDAGEVPDGAAFVCAPEQETDECAKCLESKCCQEYLDCGRDEFCAYRSDADPGEAICIQQCLIAQAQDAGVVDVAVCASSCQGDRATVSDATNALINCISDQPSDGGVLQNCSTVCFGAEL